MGGLSKTGGRLACACAALAALCVSPAGATAQEEPNGAAADIRAVSAVAPVRTDNGGRALEVYRALVPEGLTMPAEPAVGVWLAEASTGRSVPGRPLDDAGHWIEGAVQIRVRHAGKDGWYPIHYPVTAEFWFQAGRYVGLPKRRANASITQQGTGWRAESTARGTTGGPAFSMDWAPAGGTDPAKIQTAFRQSTGPFFPLNAPLEGPDLMRVQYTLNPPYPFQTAIPGGPPAYSSSAPPDAGMVRLRMRDDLDAIQEPDLPKIFPKGATLGDIVDLDQTVPGTHAFYALTLGSESSTIGKGRRRSGSPAPGAGGKKGAGCRKARVATVRVKGLRRSRVRSIRARAGGKRVRARLVSRGRVRVDLRRLKRTTYRVRITVVSKSGKRKTYRRMARRCARR